MKEVFEILKELKGYGLKRDVFYIASGFFLLLILDFLYQPNLNSFPNIQALNTLGKMIVIIVISYFLAYFCNTLGIFANNIVFAILKNNKYSGARKYIRDLKNYINGVETHVVPNGNITNSEINHFIFSNDGLFSLYERKAQSSIFRQIFIGFTIVLSIVYSSFILFITIILLGLQLMSQFNTWENRVDIAHFMRAIKLEKSRSIK